LREPRCSSGSLRLTASTPAYALKRAGFTVETSDCFVFAASRFEPAIPHILGVARLWSATAKARHRRHGRTITLIASRSFMAR
jgi:hypothetical protein